MKILLICNKSPYPPKEGGPIAMNMMVEGLIKAGHQVKVLAMNTNKYFVEPSLIPADYMEKTGLELVYIDLKINPFKAFLNLFTNRSFHVERFISPVFREKIEHILLHEEFDIVQFEILYVSPYLQTVQKFSRAKTVLRAHNIEYLIWERIAETTVHPLKRLYLRHLASTLKAYELSVINKFDGIAAITENDAEFFRASSFASGRQPPAGQNDGSGKAGIANRNNGKKVDARITAISFGIDLDRFKAPAREPEFPSLFSIGAMNWIPNLEGIKWFLENVWPDVHSQFPGLKYYIAGREMPGWLKESHHENVIVAGEVEDALDFMYSYSVMVVPLFSGSGIRIKIIEGMAAGKTIISTTLGAEGIHCANHENILIADQPCEFFDMISLCVKNEMLCRKIGENARKLIEEQYNRDSIIQKLLGFYKNLRA